MEVYLPVGAGKIMNTLFSSNSDDAVCTDWSLVVLARTLFKCLMSLAPPPENIK